MGKAIWEHPIETWLGENSKLWMSLCTSWKRVILFCVCGWHKKLAGKKQNLDPMWKLLNKEVDLGEPTSFLDHVYLGCTQRQCEINKDIVDNYRTMFESRISAGGVEKLPFPQNLRILHGLMTLLVMQRSVWNDIVSWQTRRINNSTKHLHHARWPPLQRRRNEVCWRIVTCMLSNCSEHAYTWQELDDLIIYGQ